MKFPGSKLLHTWDLSTRQLTLDDLLRSCEQVSLTGFAELQFAQAVGMIFYYLGAEVNAVYRERAETLHGSAAVERLAAAVRERDGSVSIYELPLDMAHLLRGMVHRRRIEEQPRNRGALAAYLNRLALASHTGTLEVQTPSGAAMLLIVSGRVSNVYWETPAGLTVEKKEGRQRLDQALDAGGATQLYLSDFSRDVWKGRHEAQATPTRLVGVNPDANSEQLAAEESTLRTQLLEEVDAQVPGLLQAFVIDLLTGVVLARKTRGTEAIRVALLAEKVPAVTMYLKDLVATDEDEIEFVELSTGRVATLVYVVPELEEAVAVLADKSQPTALVGGTLGRLVRVYASRMSPGRRTAARA